MARGDHPMRTPLYGGLLVAVAMVGGALAAGQRDAWPGWAETVVLVVVGVAMLVGVGLTLRDRTPPRRPRN
jgi:UDP-N-acetylmuramyl pentapeptide phosphotransferase/UDP-N-acetylglucosamine-1-phosphate transferase